MASTEKDTPEAKTELETTIYTVQKGDNISSIAKKFNITAAELKELNNLVDANVKTNSQLKVLKSDKVAVLKDEIEIKNFISYNVLKGDNLGSIAKKYNVTVALLQEWNELKDNTVQVGKKILILSNPKQEVATSERIEHYLVKKGDSLFKIAQKYPGVSVTDIKKWNGITGNELKPGMKLKISG